jgi:two-component system response regulator PhcR
MDGKKEPSIATARASPAILFVDDEPSAVERFSLAFKADFPILTATSFAGAEQVLAEHGERVGVLVADQRMPARTGVELLVFARINYPRIIRVLTTADPDLHSAVEAINSGEIHRYIVKPWNIPSLRAELRGAMERYLRNRREQELIASKRLTVATLAAHVAHEMATPLTTVRLLASSMEDYWPALVDAYCRERQSNEPPGKQPAIPEEMLDTLASAPEILKTVAERAGMFMQLTLVNAREDAADTGEFRPFSMRHCVLEALRSYAFGEGERQLVQLDGGDFQVWGSDVLMTFVLYNLLKNALHAVNSAHGGEVRIEIRPDSPYNLLVVRDTGTGIPEDALPHIFEEFFSGTGRRRGTGMGLPFCRRAVNAFGGQIECRSRVGEHTEMRLAFPRPRSD